MRGLVSAGCLGGAGGAERALDSVLRALEADEVDVVVREQLGGPFAQIGARTQVFPLDWRWRASARTTGIKGALIQRAVNPPEAWQNHVIRVGDDVGHRLVAVAKGSSAGKSRPRLGFGRALPRTSAESRDPLVIKPVRCRAGMPNPQTQISVTAGAWLARLSGGLV